MATAFQPNAFQNDAFQVAGGTLFFQSLTGSLTFTGTVAKKTGKPLAGSLSFSGTVTKKAGKSLAGSLAFTGSLFWRMLKALSAGLSFVGTLTTQKIAGAKRMKKRISMIQLPEEVTQWLW